MKSHFPIAAVVFLTLLSACSSKTTNTPENISEESAVYSVTFSSDWSEETHPEDFPASGHFSGLIGATHSSDVSFWNPNTIASPGIEEMAEKGGKDLLTEEVNTAISQNSAFSVLSGDGISDIMGSVTLTFEVNKNYPLVSLVSMIGPSPDWFVGVHDFSLLEEGEWIEEATIELYTYDSGTDNGTRYRSDNDNTEPFVPIFKKQDVPFKENGTIPAMGTFTFQKVD